MKKRFAEFPKAAAPSRGQPQPGWWRRVVSWCLGRPIPTGAGQRLDQLLREPLGEEFPAVSAGLHAQIMQAVRASRQEEIRAREAERRPWATAVLRWGLATAALALLIGGAWLVVRQYGPGSGGKGAPGPMARSESLPPVAPMVEELATNSVALLSVPMQRQIEDLSEHLRQTAQFLLASLP